MTKVDLATAAEAFAGEIDDLEAILGDLLAGVSAGTVTTYGDLASALGDKVASRWVATILLDAHGTRAISSHRVLRAGGEIGLHYSGDSQKKVALLQAEGIEILNGKVPLSRYQAQLPEIDPPLEKLKQRQATLPIAQRSSIQLADIRTAGGLDVSYAERQAFAACVTFDVGSRENKQTYIQSLVRPFPYISGYLAFREIPVYLNLLAKLQTQGDLPDVLLVDGNGKLHPRQCGIATMLGALTEIPAIGVAKKKLTGHMPRLPSVGQDVPIYESKASDNILGYAILPSAKTKHPIYVSQGFAIDDQTMLAVVRGFLMGHRLPEPIYRADRESRAAAGSRSI